MDRCDFSVLHNKNGEDETPESAVSPHTTEPRASIGHKTATAQGRTKRNPRKHTEDRPEISDPPMQTSHCSNRTRRSSQKRQPSLPQATGDGRFKRFLPSSEERFLKDMLSDNPRYLSKNQQKPSEYWEEAAAPLPEYQGPWQQYPFTVV